LTAEREQKKLRQEKQKEGLSHTHTDKENKGIENKGKDQTRMHRNHSQVYVQYYIPVEAEQNAEKHHLQARRTVKKRHAKDRFGH